MRAGRKVVHADSTSQLLKAPTLYNPPMLYILSFGVGGMGRRERDEGKWLVKPAILKPMKWGFHDTGQKCRQALASGSTVYSCPSFLTPIANVCNSLVLI